MIRFRNELDILRSLSDVSRNIFILYGHCEDESKHIWRYENKESIKVMLILV